MSTIKLKVSMLEKIIYIVYLFITILFVGNGNTIPQTNGMLHYFKLWYSKVYNNPDWNLFWYTGIPHIKLYPPFFYFLYLYTPLRFLSIETYFRIISMVFIYCTGIISYLILKRITKSFFVSIVGLTLPFNKYFLFYVAYTGSLTEVLGFTFFMLSFYLALAKKYRLLPFFVFLTAVTHLHALMFLALSLLLPALLGKNKKLIISFIIGLIFSMGWFTQFVVYYLCSTNKSNLFNFSLGWNLINPFHFWYIGIVNFFLGLIYLFMSLVNIRNFKKNMILLSGLPLIVITLLSIVLPIGLIIKGDTNRVLLYSLPFFFFFSLRFISNLPKKIAVILLIALAIDNLIFIPVFHQWYQEIGCSNSLLKDGIGKLVAGSNRFAIYGVYYSGSLIISIGGNTPTIEGGFLQAVRNWEYIKYLVTYGPSKVKELAANPNRTFNLFYRMGINKIILLPFREDAVIVGNAIEKYNQLSKSSFYNVTRYCSDNLCFYEASLFPSPSLVEVALPGNCSINEYGCFKRYNKADTFSNGTVNYSIVSPQEIHIDYNFSDNGYIVIKQMYHPFWTAIADDGSKLQILETDVGTMLIKVHKSGNIKLKFVEPIIIKIAYAISFILLIMYLSVVLFKFLKPKIVIK